jgi:hypothetical protein
VRLPALVLIALAGCPTPAPPPPPPTTIERPPPQLTPPPPKLELRTDFAVGDSPMTIAVWRDHLVWTDAAGAIWSMPTSGGTPKQLSDQQAPNFAFKLFLAGDELFATSRKDLLRIASPDGPVTMAGVLSLADNPIDATGTHDDVYLTLFKRDEILRASVAGGAAKKIASIPRGVLAQNADSLFVASYSNGTLVSIPLAGGPAKTIATGLVRPTAVAADAARVFVYSEKQQSIRRIVIATGEQTVIAEGLDNADDLVADGAWLYTYTWKPRGQLLRIAKDGGRAPQVLADDLQSPHAIAFDGDAIYATIRDQDTIIKIAKAAL